MAYFLVLLHNVFAVMYYILCFAVYIAYVEEINYVMLCYVIDAQPASHYIRYTAASVLRSTTLSTPEGHWLMCAW